LLFFEGKCKTPHVTEEEIKEAFVTAFNQLVTEREEIIANARLVWQILCDTTALTEEKAKPQQELVVLVEMTEKCVRENARIAQNQEEYQHSYERGLWHDMMLQMLGLTR